MLTPPASRTKVLCVFGTRPEAIKIAPVALALEREREWCDLRICVTAQHRQLLDPVLDLFGIVPHHDLNLMEDNQSLAGLTSRLFDGVGDVVATERPDWLLVQGDTTSAFVASICGFYAGVGVGHIEAGLRTDTRRAPFPEEMNRRLVSRVADLHFAPTVRAQEHLLREGVSREDVLVTGNTAIDALLWAAAQPPPPVIAELVAPAPVRTLLVTTHRRESFGEPLERTCMALGALAHEYGSSIQILLPVHLNPHVASSVRRLLDGRDNIRLLPPLDYLTLVHLLRRSHFVLTDSGGIQEEAPSLGKPVLILRETTEREEGVAAGVARLVGTDPQRIVAEAKLLLDDAAHYERMAHPVRVYGDGHAAARIVEALKTGAARLH